jgi:hypothetical protein
MPLGHACPALAIQTNPISLPFWESISYNWLSTGTGIPTLAIKIAGYCQTILEAIIVLEIIAGNMIEIAIQRGDRSTSIPPAITDAP